MMYIKKYTMWRKGVSPFLFKLTFLILTIFFISSCQSVSEVNSRRAGVKVSGNSITVISEHINHNYQATYKINDTKDLFDEVISFSNDDINLRFFFETEHCELNRQVLIDNIDYLFPNKVFFKRQKFFVNFYLLYQKNFSIKEIKRLEEPLNFYFTIEQCDPQQTFDQLLAFIATLYHELTHIYLNNDNTSRYEEYLASKNALCANLLANNDIYMSFDSLKVYHNAQDAFENNPVYNSIDKLNDKLSILGGLDAHYELFAVFGENFSTQSSNKKAQINLYCDFN